MHGTLQPTKSVVWKIEGAGRWQILELVSMSPPWRRPTQCNGDFAMAIALMHADRDGDARPAG